MVARDEVNAKLDTLIIDIRELKSAFPLDTLGNADFSGHREAHEAMIRAANAQETFWRELRLDLAKKGLWALLTVLVGLALAGIGSCIRDWLR